MSLQLSEDCRSQNVDAFKATLGDSAEAFDACNTGPMPAPMNATDGTYFISKLLDLN